MFGPSGQDSNQQIMRSGESAGMQTMIAVRRVLVERMWDHLDERSEIIFRTERSVRLMKLFGRDDRNGCGRSCVIKTEGLIGAADLERGCCGLGGF